MEHLVSFSLFVFFTWYSLYRCVLHLYVNMNVFAFFLCFMVVYLYQKNSKAIYKYVSADTYPPAVRLAIQEELAAFNLQICWLFFSTDCNATVLHFVCRLSIS